MQVLKEFESKAFGDALEGCKIKIETQIEEKYLGFKKKQKQVVQSKLRAILKPKMTSLESKIRNESFASPHELQQEL